MALPMSRIKNKINPSTGERKDQEGDGKDIEDTEEGPKDLKTSTSTGERNERSKTLITISLAILTILTGSGILVMSTGSRLLTPSSFRSHKAMYISIYTVYALNFILTIISILLSLCKPLPSRTYEIRCPAVHTAAGYLVGGSLIILLVVLTLGAYAHFISSDQTSSPPPPPPGL